MTPGLAVGHEPMSVVPIGVPSSWVSDSNASRCSITPLRTLPG
jgi:hypothetical protein